MCTIEGISQADLALLGGGGGGGLNLFFRGRLSEANHPNLEAGGILKTRCSERDLRVVGGGGILVYTWEECSLNTRIHTQPLALTGGSHR